MRLVVVAIFLAGCSVPVADHTVHLDDNTLREVATSCSGNLFVPDDRAYAVCVPGNWTLQEHALGREWIALSPVQGENDAFRENINFGREHGSNATHLDDVAANARRALQDSGYNITTHATDTTRLGNVEAVRLRYALVLGETRILGEQYYAQAGAHLYVVTYSGPSENDLHHTEAMATLASLVFAGPSVVAPTAT